MPDNNNSQMANETQKLMNEPVRTGRTEMQVLESIEKYMGQIVNNGGNIYGMSASNARVYGKNGSDFYQRRIGRGTYNDFTTEMKKTMIEELFGTDFKKSMNELKKQLAKDLGVELGDLPTQLGQLAGKELAKRVNDSSLGKAIFDPIKKYRDNLAKEIQDAYTRGKQKVANADKMSDVLSKANATQKSQSRQGVSKDDSASIPFENVSNTIKDTVLKQVKQTTKDTSIEAAKKATQNQTASMMPELKGIMPDIADAIPSADLGEMAAASNTAEAIGGLGEIASTVAPEILALAGPVIALTAVVTTLGPAMQEFEKMLDKTIETMGRASKSREKNLDLAQERLMADVKTMVETPFKILEDAAQKWYDTWDSNLRTISATQGYTKEQVQQLYSAYVDRLRTEGLTDVIGASDISNNLANVLNAGLSGAYAEEFAYIATKLNAAIPTQDFFQYTEGYITAVSNALNQGKSQSEAIAAANAELETFANSLLYAGREISGGFTTGLKGAEELFQKAEQIAQAGRYGSGMELGSVLTSISAVTGAIAPDLASSLVDAVYKAAVGGNSSDIVALRSLAGINASNTEFLQSLVSNPQSVFGALFDNLANMQNMSNGAYMEVAEGLSSVFGISMDALARLDFTQIANAVRATGETSDALGQNMKLLQSGQTTTNAEILRMRQINEYMVDEGLAYVLDNEAGRAIQQHMWEEQIARDLMEATYAVELKGSALGFLEKLSGGLTTLGNLLNPIAWFNKIDELVTTAGQDETLQADVKSILELGKVGTGQASDLANLTAYNQALGLTENLVDLLGGKSAYAETQREIAKIRNRGGAFSGYVNDNDYLKSSMAGLTSAVAGLAFGGVGSLLVSGGSALVDKVGKSIIDATTEEYATQNIDEAKVQAYIDRKNAEYAEYKKSQPLGLNSQSQYTWNTVGKSALSKFGYTPGGMVDYNTGEVAAVAMNTAASTAQSQSKLNDNLQKMLNDMEEFYNEDTSRTYKDYIATAKRYGISDFTEAVEKSGLTEESIQNQYEALQGQAGARMKAEREQKEEKFWEDDVLKLTETTSWLESINSTATNIYNIFDKFLDEWEDYFIRHTVYNNAYNRDTVEKVLSAERDSSETAIYALADALTQNDISLLRDPTIQTNALLAQILKVANAILTQQGAGGTSISLPDTLAGLSLGIINQS
jgi:hypothetical protein